MTIEAFEADWRKRWLVERGVEIISEASRRLSEDLKLRHPNIPWAKVAGIGNVLRHEYEGISAPVMWKLAQDDLNPLEKVCREELAKGHRTPKVRTDIGISRLERQLRCQRCGARRKASLDVELRPRD